MEGWRKDSRHEPIIVDLEALVPKEHLLRKIEKVMDYEWLYERLDPYYYMTMAVPAQIRLCWSRWYSFSIYLEYRLCGRPTRGSRIRSPTAGFEAMGCWIISPTLRR